MDLTNSDDITTLIGHFKTGIGVLVTILGIFHASLSPELQSGLMTLGVTGYLVFDWGHAYFTNKPNKKKDEKKYLSKNSDNDE
jgi:hypothetical protein